MLILLPPSEGKAAPSRGPALALHKLSHRSLMPERRAVQDALVRVCSGPASTARRILSLGPKQADEISRNARLLTEPTAPAIEVYSGVLFEALDAGTLVPAARKRLDAHVLIASALFGLLTPTDRIPAYRLSGDVTLPGIGPLATFWRDGISAVLAEHDGMIVDLRSGVYTKLGPIPPDVAERSFVGRILLERDGKRSVVSHHNKATKGRLARALMSRGAVPNTEAAFTKAVTGLGYRLEIHEARRSGQPATMDIIVTHT